MIRRTGMVVLGMAAIVGILAWPVAWIVDRSSGVDAVILKSPADAQTIELNRSQWDDADKGPGRREAIASIYGSVAPRAPTERLVFLDESLVVRPKEDDSLVLVKSAEGTNLVQAKTLYFVAERAIFVALVGAILGFLLLRYGSKKT